MAGDLSRRAFVGVSAVAAAGGLSACTSALSATRPAHAVTYPPGTKILFQGDSITDVGRNRMRPAPNLSLALGGGYPQLIAASVLHDAPACGLEFYNRGVSGNVVSTLAERWERDTIAVRPDVVSLLVGVNDFMGTFDGAPNATADDYERGLLDLITRTRTALPAVRLVMLEPFAARTGLVTDAWFPGFDERRAVAARVAKRVSATFIPLQAMFDDLAKTGGPSFWIGDGIHPTPAGHMAIARRWRAAVGL